jgi:hypothetical protein
MPKSYVTGPKGASAIYYTSADLRPTSQGYTDPVTGALWVRGGIQERDDAWEDASGTWHVGDMPTDWQAPPETPPPETPDAETPPAETPPSDEPPSYSPPAASGGTDYGGFNIPPPTMPRYDGGVPSYVPETPVFTPPAYTPPPAFTPPTYTPPPAFSYADYAPGETFNYADYAPSETFTYDPYRATTEADLYADPSYTFRVGEGLQALTNSAAARGVANTGGTLKDFLNYGQSAASQEFGAVDTRRLQDYTTNRGNAFGNWQANAAQRAQDYSLARGNAFANWQANEAKRQADYTLGRQGAVDTYNTNYQTQYQDPYKIAYQAATDTYNTNYQTQYVDPYKAQYQAAVDEFTPQMTAYQTQAQAGQHESDLNRSYDYQTWLQQYNMWRNNRNDTFDEKYRITALQ